MTSAAYLTDVKERLLLDPLITGFHVVRERSTATDGYIRIKATLIDGSSLECAEYVQHTPDSDILRVVTYSHHWADKEAHLIRRWDNTPHFPDVPGFPHHCHRGDTGTVESGREMDISGVLEEIRRLCEEQ